ncbi:MAG: carbohydrate ABC transporter permease [Pelolinea sp.]|jgi:multiple sugar transport system permease protein|nr:carbohydrate ABC transporter permease [Pelolinea sp.]
MSNKPHHQLKLLPKWFRRFLFYLGLLLLAIPFIFPFWWMATSSFKTYKEIFAYPPALFPEEWHFENFITAFTYQPFAKQYFNSLYIALLVTVGVLIISSLSGYAFARIDFKGRNFFFILLLSSLMMPPEVTIIPNYLIMNKLGWTDTHLPLIVIPILGSGGVFTTFMMRQFFITIPKDMEDAAKIDGLGWWGIFWKIGLPLAKAPLAAVAIITFLNSWNSYLEPLIYLSDSSKYTLPLALTGYIDAYGAPMWSVQMAATTLSVLPVLIFFILAQQQVVESFAMSGVKG